MSVASNLQTAEEIATKMGLAVDAVQRAAGTTITKAKRTTLTVNVKAQEANDEAVMLAELFFTCFQGTIDNIHSAAKEFERTDVELGSSINELLPHAGALDKWMTHTRARNR